MTISDSEKKRFYQKMKISSGNKCWEWVGAMSGNGYGNFGFKGKTDKAHRVSWVIHNLNAIPEGMCVCHKCDNRACVNPNHLFLGTQQENMLDMVKKGRHVSPDQSGEKHPRTKLTTRCVRNIRSLIAMGASCKKMASIYKLDSRAISSIKIGKTWKNVAAMDGLQKYLDSIKWVGSRSSFAVLKNEDVIKIREELKRGKSGRSLAREYNVDPTTISFIKNRKTWKHI